MTMNLFELYDYIESVENRVKVLEKLIVKDTVEGEKFKPRPPFYYRNRREENG